MGTFDFSMVHYFKDIVTNRLQRIWLLYADMITTATVTSKIKEQNIEDFSESPNLFEPDCRASARTMNKNNPFW